MSTRIKYDPNLAVPKPYPGDAEGSFVLGTDSDVLQTVLIKSSIENELLGHVWFGWKTAGPPGHVHGGCQAAVLDEMMGSTGWYYKHPVVAAKIEFELLEMVPYEKEYDLRGFITKVDKRKVHIEAQLFKGEVIYARSKGLFIILKDEHMKKLDMK